jgi:hypothetical protein
LWASRRLIEEIRRTSHEDIVGPFTDDAFEAELRNQVRKIVIIDEFGISEHFGFLAEVFFNECSLQSDLFGEFFAAVEERKGMIIGFREKFDAAGVGEFLEGIEDLGIIAFELVHDDAGKGIGTAELSFEGLDEFENHVVCGQIALIGNFSKDFGVFVFVEVGCIGIEDAVSSESKWLVHLKVKAN